MSDNLELWNAVCTTDPKWTSAFKKRGGFSGTSVNHIWQLHQATALWGPKGLRWGDRELEHLLVDGDTPKGAPGPQKVWMTHVELWYPVDGATASVSQWGNSVFLDWNQTGGYMRMNDEAAKMARTNGLSKCLSELGFSADLWQKLMDDPAYRKKAGLLHETKAKMSSDEATITSMLKRLDDVLGCTTDEERAAVCWWAADVSLSEATTQPAAANKVLTGLQKKAAQGVKYPKMIETAMRGGDME